MWNHLRQFALRSVLTNNLRRSRERERQRQTETGRERQRQSIRYKTFSALPECPKEARMMFITFRIARRHQTPLVCSFASSWKWVASARNSIRVVIIRNFFFFSFLLFSSICWGFLSLLWKNVFCQLGRDVTAFILLLLTVGKWRWMNFRLVNMCFFFLNANFILFSSYSSVDRILTEIVLKFLLKRFVWCVVVVVQRFDCQLSKFILFFFGNWHTKLEMGRSTSEINRNFEAFYLDADRFRRNEH